MSYNRPSEWDDVIDSRSVIDRVNELESVIENHEGPGSALDEDEWSELASLRDLAVEGEAFDDWSYGLTLIRDSYFQDYAKELAEDIGAIDPNAGWPLHCIDWEQAATELLVDYTSVEFRGITYWAR